MMYKVIFYELYHQFQHFQDADPLLCDYYINMTQFEQHCEPTGATYPVSFILSLCI